MMITMQFVLQIILLAVGFGVGYWLIITANSQEGTIKTFGQTLGGVLIIMAMILEIFSSYYSMKISNNMQSEYLMNPTQNDNNGSLDDRSEPDQDKNIQSVNPPEGEEQKASEESKNIPIKRNIEDHE